MIRSRVRRDAFATSAPRRRWSRNPRLSVESLEERIVLDAGPSDLAMLSATTADSRSVTFQYRATLSSQDAPLAAFVVFYRSADPLFSPEDDLTIGSRMVTLDEGEHTVTASLSQSLSIDPSHPYVLAVADPLEMIAESDEGNNTSSFRVFTIGAVTHGFELFPGDSAWVDEIAGSLEESGYDVGIAFHWDSLSALPVPGMTSLSGLLLAGAVSDAVASLSSVAHDGDVISLHMIGHSRGSVVISQAALDLELFEQVSPALGALKAGALKLTFLDPHPANNAYTGTLYSAAPTFLGQLGVALYTAFQSLALDPNVVVPASADWAEVYYQRTSYTKAQNGIESNFLLWGESPSDITVLSPLTRVSSLDLTDIVPGHFLIHDWYHDTLSINSGAGVTRLGSPGALSLASAPSGQLNADEAYASVFAELRALMELSPNRPSGRPSGWRAGVTPLRSRDVPLGS